MAGIGPIKFTITNGAASTNPCEYKILITADADTNNAFNVNFFFDIDTSLFDFVSMGTPTLGTVVDATPPTFQWFIADLPQHDPQTLEVTVKYKGNVGGEVCPFLELPEGKDYNYTYTNKPDGTNPKEHTLKKDSCQVTVAGCGPKVPFNLITSVTPGQDCKYIVRLEVQILETLTDLKIFYTINTDKFIILHQIPSPGNVVPEPLESPSSFKWTIGNINAGVVAILTIELQYKAGLPTEEVDFLTHIGYQIGDDQRVFSFEDVTGLATECPTPCCECPCIEETETIELGPCDQHETKTVDVKVQPQGNILFVNLRFPSVCPNKKIAVLVMLFEVHGMTETLKAYKIIERPNTSGTTDCEEGEACSKITFLIPAECTECACDSCPERKFRIKTVAHYLATGNIPLCECPRA